MSLITHLSIKTKEPGGELVEVLPVGTEIKYKLSFEAQELSRSVNGALIAEKRTGKVRLTVEGFGFIPDLLRQHYLNSVLEVTPGIRVYSAGTVPEYAMQNSVVRKQTSTSYRTRFQMMLTQFSCEHCEPDLAGDSGSKWKLILEEL